MSHSETSVYWWKWHGTFQRDNECIFISQMILNFPNSKSHIKDRVVPEIQSGYFQACRGRGWIKSKTQIERGAGNGIQGSNDAESSYKIHYKRSQIYLDFLGGGHIFFCYAKCTFFLSFNFKFIFFKLEDNCFTELCWFLPNIHMNQPYTVYLSPLPLEPPSHLLPDKCILKYILNIYLFIKVS